jgi:hypothetical protein
MTRRPPSKTLAPSKGLYANSFEVGYTAFEFVIDFSQTYTGKSSRSHTRIVTSPIYARALLTTLGHAVGEYAERFGPVAEEPPARKSRGGDGGTR